jgi:hypothetical protein
LIADTPVTAAILFFNKTVHFVPMPSKFGPSGAMSIGDPRIAALAQLLLYLPQLPFRVFDAIESVVKTGVVHRFGPGEYGREGAAKFPPFWYPMVRCVCHRKLLETGKVPPRRPVF